MKSSIGAVKVFDSHIDLNGEIISEIGQLSEKTKDYAELHVEAHNGVKPARVIEVMNVLRVTRSGPIHFQAVSSWYR